METAISDALAGNSAAARGADGAANRPAVAWQMCVGRSCALLHRSMISRTALSRWRMRSAKPVWRIAAQNAMDGFWALPVNSAPRFELRGQLFAIERCAQQMALEGEVLADGTEAREKSLRALRPGESLACAARAHGWADGCSRRGCSRGHWPSRTRAARSQAPGPRPSRPDSCAIGR